MSDSSSSSPTSSTSSTSSPVADPSLTYTGAVDIECDLVVLGGGPGGYSAAFRAADLGLKVVLANSGEEWAALIAGGDYFAVLVQMPTTSGSIH